MDIYTKKGDKGETSLWGGDRVLKSDPQVECYGIVDEANSCLGLARGLTKVPSIKEALRKQQARLQVLSAELASTAAGAAKLKETIQASDIAALEQEIDSLMSSLPKMTEFVLPGGDSPASGAIDLARTIVRRAERQAVRLRQERELREEISKYLNRLSDYLFALARVEENENLVRVIKDEIMEKIGGNPGPLTPELAKEMIQASFAKADSINLPVVAAVVDANGDLLVLERQPGALVPSIDIAWKKAFTACSLRMPTHAVGEAAQPGQPLYGIENTCGGEFVIFGGGFPLLHKNKVVGGFGISGGSVDEDMMVAKPALDLWEKKV